MPVDQNKACPNEIACKSTDIIEFQEITIPFDDTEIVEVNEYTIQSKVQLATFKDGTTRLVPSTNNIVINDLIISLTTSCAGQIGNEGEKN